MKSESVSRILIGVAFSLLLGLFAGCLEEGGGASSDGGYEACPERTEGCPCYHGAICNNGLTCENGVCVGVGPGIGEEGGPCYSNDSCDSGLVCNSDGYCESAHTADGDIVPDGDDVADGDEAADGDGAEGPCAPAPGWPPDPETDPWYAGRECSFPDCDDTVEDSCYDDSGLWTQTLTTVSHTCGAMAEMFDERLKEGYVDTIPDVSFNTIGECDYRDGVIVGVIKGPSGIFCDISYEDDGMGGTITIMETGVATLDGEDLIGTARAFLFDLPMGTPDCWADYILEFTRQ